MLIKPGVDISRLKPPIRKKLNLLEQLHYEVGHEMVITSTYEGTHSAGSLHYADLAIDMRHPKDKDNYLRDLLKDHFDDNYDIVFESDHIHIEYDPK